MIGIKSVFRPIIGHWTFPFIYVENESVLQSSFLNVNTCAAAHDNITKNTNYIAFDTNINNMITDENVEEERH